MYAVYGEELLQVAVWEVIRFAEERKTTEYIKLVV